jgi:hypothetical protein
MTNHIESGGERTNPGYWRIQYVPDMKAFRVDSGITYKFINEAEAMKRLMASE